MKFEYFQNPAILNLVSNIFSAKLPIKVAYKAAKIQKVIGSEFEKYGELRNKVIQEYCQKDEEGKPLEVNGNIKLIEDKVEDFTKEILELHQIEFDLPYELSLEDLEKVELSSSDLITLSDIGLIKLE